uniref:AlNc14C242G9498 protein n=1 Tax=Albugo laibachii Nc14 TaxID=890382 RepID=F0WT08_9STRA|nr:AlNc14C242G9498 [Albugo laibachii Nc14]|eukprot:CCA24493.1 AlNc14C242G9498 [Albugo laibachii Nc14]
MLSSKLHARTVTPNRGENIISSHREADQLPLYCRECEDIVRVTLRSACESIGTLFLPYLCCCNLGLSVRRLSKL